MPGLKRAAHVVMVLVAALALAGAVVTTGDAWAAACVPETFPDKWLESQEADGGHTIARHVGKSDGWLVNRLASQSRIGAASSFSSLVNARRGIRTALSRYRTAINAWAATAGSRARRAWVYDGATTLGRVAARPIDAESSINPVTPTTDLKVVVMADGTGGCILLTAYPNPE
jgi:hypothetical protein